jgi:hypothetical protein
MPDRPLAPPPAVLDLQAAIAARRGDVATRIRAIETYDVTTLSLALMMLLDGADDDARELLETSGLTGDEVLALGKAGTKLGRIAPQIVRGRRR